MSVTAIGASQISIDGNYAKQIGNRWFHVLSGITVYDNRVERKTLNSKIAKLRHFGSIVLLSDFFGGLRFVPSSLVGIASALSVYHLLALELQSKSEAVRKIGKHLAELNS